MSKKTAIVTGCLGQDGSYLTEYLLSLDYLVIGITKRHSSDALSYGHLAHVRNNDNFKLHHGDIVDPIFMAEIITKYKPNEFYSLAAQSHVGHSFSNPIDTFNIDATAVITILSLLQKHSLQTRFYQASTSELFGGIECPTTGYDEQSLFYPRSPYGVAKLAAHWVTINYREAYNMYACAGILFNHESMRRGLDFITRKVTHTVASIKLELQDKLTIGNIDAYRDWGDSEEYVKAMHLMLQQDKAKEYVVATGKAYSVRDLIIAAFECADILDWESYINYDEKYMRPSEVPYLLGNPSKIKTELGWSSTVSFKDLVYKMYKSDYDSLRRQGLGGTTSFIKMDSK